MKKMLFILGSGILVTGGFICYNIIKKNIDEKNKRDDWETIVKLATEKTANEKEN